MKKIFFVPAAVFISSQLSAQADTLLLDPANITATKFEQKQSQSGKVVTVISKEQLSQFSGRSLGQVLTEQAGLTIAGAFNAPGSVQTVFMRGASSGRTLILLDGIPVNDPSMIGNEFDLNLFSIQDIERIEICRGAQSTLYGSDAIAGVINIITTKKDVNRAINLSATTAFGNKNTTRNNVQLYGKTGKLNYSTRFSKLNTDGFSSAHDPAGNMNFDRDGYDGHVASAALQYQFHPTLSARAFILHSRYKAAIDANPFTDDRDFSIRNSNLSAGGGIDFKKGIVSITGNYQYGGLERNYLNDSAYISGFAKYERNEYRGRTQFVELYSNIRARDWLTILAGADYRWGNMNQQYLSVSSFGPFASAFDDTSVHQASFYGSLIVSAFNKRMNIEAGARFNDHSRYGNNSTFTLNPSFAINNHFRIFGSIATGFKAPSIYQLNDGFSGNPALKAEKSTNYELGVQQNHKKISSRLVYFHRDIKNGIDFDYASSFTYFNFVKQVVDGIELEFTARPVSKLDITVNYTWISGEETTQSRKTFSDSTYGYLLRRPEHSFNINLGYSFCKGLYGRVSGRVVSSRFDVGGYQSDDVKLDGYVLLNAYLEWAWKKEVKFFADLQNITNKKFFDIRGYNAIPFLVNGGVTFSL